MTRPNHEDDGSRSSDEAARQDRPTSDPVGQPEAISELPETTIQAIADLWTEILVRDLQSRHLLIKILDNKLISPAC